AARYRRPRLHRAVATLLGARWGSPTMVVVEDLQWTDQASRDLLADLAEGVADRPWLVLTTRREMDDPVTDSEQAQTLSIGPLPVSATAALGQGAVDETPLPPAVLEELTERSGGNPLFLSELITAARQAGGAEALPDTVGSLITSRIDRLPAPERRTLRQLSVLGAGFDAALAAEVLEIGGVGLADALTRVGGFVDRDGDEVRFRHNLLRDVAYEGLPFRERRRLHARAANVLERAGDTSLLSVHAFLAGRMGTAWQASVAAGRAAAGVYANVDAARFLTRALRAGRHVRAVSAGQRAEVAELLGDVQRRLGDTGAATAAYRSARRRCQDEVTLARLSLKQARAQAGGQRFSQALATISRALRRLERLPGRAAASQRAELMVWYGHFRQEQGRHAEALEAVRQAIAQAEAADATAPLAHALRLLDWIHAGRGELHLAVHSERSLELFTELGDLSNQASVLNNLGGFAYWAGRWEEAAERYRRAQELDERTGDVVGAAFTRNNLAEILADQGRFEESEALLGEAERTFRGTGYTAGVAYVRMNLGRVAAHAGQRDLARQRLTSALALHREVGAAASAFETEARLAEVALLSGDDDAQVLATVDGLLARAATDGGVVAATPLLHRIRGAVLTRRGDTAAALEALTASEQAARARDADFEVALAQAAWADVATRDGRASEAVEPREAAAETLALLGVRRVPWDAAGRLAGVS
ncbi:MAG: ATP-binding protein, partial [Actinomycetota bacterium]